MSRVVGPTMTERTAHAPVPTTRPSASETTRPRPVTTRHCWLTDPTGQPSRRPAFLVEWRQHPAGAWQGRVVYVLDEPATGQPTLVEVWVDARLLHPA